MKVKVIALISNGSQFIIKHLTTIDIKESNTSKYKKMKIKDYEIESYSNHVVYDWYNYYMDEVKLPQWLIDSNTHDIIIKHE